MSAHEYPLLIKSLLLAPLRQRTRNEIVYRDISRYDYRTFRNRVGRLGSALTALGVKPGDTVAVMDWDSHRYLECFFAVPMLGAVLQTVNIRLSAEQVHYTIDHAGASVILCNIEFIGMLEAIRPMLREVRKVVCLKDRGEVTTHFDWDGEYEELLAAGDPGHDFPDFDENTRATTFYTTGTTGLPKGVYFSHRQLVLHTLAELAALRFHPDDDVYMPITPMFHVHAWGIPYAATAAGLKQVYPGRYAPDILLKLAVSERVTFSHCVPTILKMILDCPEAGDHNFEGWRIIIGGSALPKTLCETALGRGIDVLAGYGMSETCPLLGISRVQPALIEGVGTELDFRQAVLPIHLVDLRIVDSNMRDLPHDGTASGEIVVRAPWLTQGYHKNEQASEDLWVGGYLHTADIGTIDSHGYLRITDRIKDVIKTGGEWISSLQLEDIIAVHPEVAEVAVIGVADEKWGERPMAIVVPRKDAELDAAQIKSHVMRHVDQGIISKFAVPEMVILVASIDKTSVGKIDKKALRQQYVERPPAPTTAV